MLQIDLWKRIAIVLTCLVGLWLALPNAFYGPVERHNDAVQAIELSGSTESLEADRALWPEWMPSGLVNLGLDLRGGAHLLAEVKLEDVYASRMEATWPEVRDALRSLTPVRRQQSPEDEVRVRLQDPSKMGEAMQIVRGLARPVQSLTGAGSNDIEVSGADGIISVTLSDAERASTDERTMHYVIEAAAVVTGEELVDAQPTVDQNGNQAVSFRFNTSGARKFGDYTADNIGSPFAIVLDDEVISAPTIQSHIPGGSGIITGQFSLEETTQLAVLLRAGALPAELTFVEERTIGPELGQDSIDAGKVATMVAFAAVLFFMFASYGLFGVFANIALIVNVGLLFGLLSLIGATLTLPGIGMAVDANVLIFERIREELKTAKGPARAIELGYEKALSAILDANITTFITAVILFAMGSGPVRGFAITLGLGIITSVFTAIFVTRLLVVFWFERRRPKTIEV